MSCRDTRAVVLIVEDNALNRDMLSRRLSRKGYTVLQAVDAASGIDLARGEGVDLVLMDMSLPGMDGWAATRLLKEDTSTRRIPVIALTAHAMASDRAAALAAGCDEYETKPIDLPRLLAKMQHCLAGRRDELPGPLQRSED